MKGAYVVGGRDVGAELAQVQYNSNLADELNLNKMGSLRWQGLTFSDPRQSIGFSIGSDNFLAVADNAASTQYLFKWDPSALKFVSYQNFSEAACQAVSAFRIDTQNINFLIWGLTSGQSRLYKYNSGTQKFELPVSIGSAGPTYEWKFFGLNGLYFLAQGVAGGTSGNTFRWNNVTQAWGNPDTFTTAQTNDYEFFTDASNNIYELVAVPSAPPIRRWLGSAWTTSATLPFGVTKASSFTLNGVVYLVTATTTVINVLRADAPSTVVASATTTNTVDVLAFNFGNHVFVLSINSHSSSSSAPSELFQWNSNVNQLISVATLPAVYNNTHFSTFPIGTDIYAFLCTGPTSYLYRLSL